MFIPNPQDIIFDFMSRALSGDKKKDDEDTTFADSLFDLLTPNEDAADERADAALKNLDKVIEKEQERLDEKQEQYYLNFIHGLTDADLFDSIQSYSVISRMLFG